MRPHRLARLLDGSLTLHAHGGVDPATAWHRYDELALWPRWAPHLRRVDADAPTLTAGGRVRGPLGVTAGFAVVAVEPERRRWTWRVRSGPLVVLLEHGVDAPPGGTGSRTWLTMRGPYPVLLGYAPLAWWALHRLVTLRGLRGGAA